MPVSINDIPELRLTTLQGLVERFVMPPDLYFSNQFAEADLEGDTAEWESFVGSRGLAPFAAPDSESKETSPGGYGLHKLSVAYWKERMHFGSDFLNKLRKPGTLAKQTAQEYLARQMTDLENRNRRRKEWMIAQMITKGGFTYVQPNDVKISVDYGIPADHKVTLTTDYKWGSGTSSDMIGDILAAKLALQNDSGAAYAEAYLTTELLYTMLKDANIQKILEKSAYGNGDLYARPKEVLSDLLGITFVIYDEMFQIRSWLIANVTGGSTTVFSVDEAMDYAAGDSLYIYCPEENKREKLVIASVDANASTITVSVAPTNSYKALKTCVYVTRKFIPTNTFTMFAPEVQGTKSCEFKRAPFGLNGTYGMQVDRKETWDPDGVFIRVQDKGLPVLYNPDAVYILTAM